MLVKPFTQYRPRKYETMVGELYEEWAHPNPDTQEPLILEEKDRGYKLVHVYVIWSKWNNVDGIERSEIIIDAAQKKLATQDVLEMTVAMGLTPDEAHRMGIGS